MERFHSDLAMGKFAEPVKLEVGELETTVGELEQTIKKMENFGEKLASSMESAAVGKWQSIDAEDTVHKQLVELIEQMRGLLVQASQTEEHSQKIMALSNFETLYAQAMKLQVQMNNLRLSHLERNREIMVIKRQLLLQEVNNLLLQADITRRETELYQFQEAKRFATVKRWNTFGGTERRRPQAQMELPVQTLTPTYGKAGSQKEIRQRQGEVPHINIPYIPEEVILTSETSTAHSAAATNSATEAVGDSQTALHKKILDKFLPQHETTRELSTNHVDTYRDQSRGRSPKHESPLLETYLAQQQVEGAKTLPKSYTISNHQQPRQNLPEQYFLTSTATLKTLKESAIINFQPNSSTESATESTDKITEDWNKLQSTSKKFNTKDSDLTKNAKSSSVKKTEFTTLCDSAPLYNELAELRRMKKEMEKGASTLRVASSGQSSKYYSPTMESSTEEVSDQTVPRQRSLRKPLLPETALHSIDYSPVSSLKKRSKKSSIEKQIKFSTDSELLDLRDFSVKPPLATRSGLRLQFTNECRNTDLKSPPSPLRDKILRQQKIKRDYRATSPYGSPASTRGKPPLPHQISPVKISPVKISPSASPVARKCFRSKSVSDIDPVDVEFITVEPLQEVIRRFEKRATVSVNVNRQFDIRKTPSPTLYLPRVGLVSRVKKLKPSSELLEESQRYRSGQSIYATRILQRYFPKDDQKPDSATKKHEKDNSSCTSAQRLSLDTTTSAQRLSLDTTTSAQRLSQGTTTSAQRLSLDTTTSAQRLSLDTTTSAQRLSLDTTTSAQRLSLDTTTSAQRLSLDTTTSAQRLSLDSTTSAQRLSLDSTTSAQRLPQGTTTSTQITGSHRAKSNISLQRARSLPSQTELQPSIVRKSASRRSGLDRNATSFKDLNNTNPVIELSPTLSSQPERESLLARLANHDVGKHRNTDSSNVMAQNGKSWNTSLSKISHQTATSSASSLESNDDVSQKQDSTSRRTSRQSIPSLGSAGVSEKILSYQEENSSKETYRVPEMRKRKSVVSIKNQSISTPSSPNSRTLLEKVRSKWKSEKLSRDKSDCSRTRSSTRSTGRKNVSQSQAETIRILCSQSVFFDVVVPHDYQQTETGGETRIKPGSRRSRSVGLYKSICSDAANAVESDIQTNSQPTSAALAQYPTTSRVNQMEDKRILSLGSSGQSTPSSPKTTKNKISKTLLDSKWLVKTKNFFKVSK